MLLDLSGGREIERRQKKFPHKISEHAIKVNEAEGKPVLNGKSRVQDSIKLETFSLLIYFSSHASNIIKFHKSLSSANPLGTIAENDYIGMCQRELGESDQRKPQRRKHTK